MEIKLNGETRSVSEGLSIAELLEQIGIDNRNLAVEYNSEFLESDRFSEIILGEGDSLEIVRFVGGG